MMKVERLGDIIKITSGGTPLTSKREYYTDGTIPWVKTGDLKVRHLTKIPDAITQLGLENSSAKIFPENTVLIAMYGATIGNCSILKTTAATNQACAALLPSEKINEEFLFFFLSSIKNELINMGVGGGQPNISATILKDIKIPLPPLSDQIRIAEILSQAESLIAQRKQSINLLDELLKSTFLEMFGDPVRNEKEWEIKTIEQLVKKGKQSIKRGPFGGALKKEIFVEKGFLVYEQFHALNNDFTFERYYISDAKFEELKAFEVFPDDIIISCSGVYLGKLAIIPKNAKRGIINQALLKISLDQKIINNKFFVFLFRHESFKNRFFGDVRGSGVPNFPPMPEFKKFQFIYPSIELQNKFVNIIEKVEALKTQYKQSLTELQNMYGVLSQKAFKGELSLDKKKSTS